MHLTQADLSTTATMRSKRKYRNMAPKPRTRTVATDCISIMPDGTRTIFKPARTRKYARTVAVKRTVKNDNAGDYAARLQMFGATGDVD